MSDLKTQSTDESVDEFLNSIADEQKKQDSFALKEIFEKVTKKPAVMWGKSIVGFGEYSYKYASGREGDWMSTGFSPRKQNLTIYIMPGFDKYADDLNKLGKHTHSVSCFYVKRLSDIDIKVLEKLITQSVKQLGEIYPKN